MANSKTLANIGNMPIFGFALGILLGSYFALCFVLRTRTAWNSSPYGCRIQGDGLYVSLVFCDLGDCFEYPP
jgi:hypothetical protein